MDINEIHAALEKRYPGKFRSVRDPFYNRIVLRWDEKRFNFKVMISHYRITEREGEPFISVDFSCKLPKGHESGLIGSASPCDTIESALNDIELCLTSRAIGINYKPKPIEEQLTLF